uniref:NADH dehydrogenase subunit 3 n=1 Tax=Setodes brevicaudatus TaxID=1876047 RepID=UPI0022DCDAC0|nr:NADH dehydrogenase subunit 3 [Setodes brevicaudatus]UZZ44383.1 NADH dehydrogenase subunit 3 [Setodes brevicaudatus]
MSILILNLILIFIICSILFIILKLISTKMTNNMNKMSPFECGFNPLNNNHTPFSIHFFIISLLFLIFDVEITLILPMILILKKSNLMIWYLICIYFMLILLISLFFEIMNNMIYWTN